MPERTSYAQGTPSWVDLPTTDQNAAKTFYAGVFGWTYDDQPMGEGAVYSIAKVHGLDVAAISPQPPEMAAAGAPPMWNTYITVDSADDAAARIGAAGGKVLMEPFDVMGAGRMVFAASGTEEESIESDTLKHGFFTYFLVQALQQEGGAVPLSQIFDYTKQHVSQRVSTEFKGYQQNPVMSRSQDNTDFALGASASGSAGGAE